MPRKSKEADKAYQQRYYLENKEKIIARSTAYNKQHRSERLKNYREKYASRYRKTKMMRIYGLSEALFETLEKLIHCQICGKEAKLTYDHNHKSGAVRGRLCHDCNLGLGKFADSAELLRKAASYLEEHD